MFLIRMAFAVSLLVLPLATTTARGQSAPPDSSPPRESHSDETHLYPDMPLEKLQRAIPSLAGLRPATSQDGLHSILDEMAGRISDFVPNLPDLISREDVSREEESSRRAPERIISLTRPGTGPLNPTTITGRTGSGVEYQYLILCRRASNGVTSLEEVRTDLKGHPLSASKNAPTLGSGFAYQWLLFGSANQTEFRFSLLGDQRVEDRETHVLAFAQIPAQVKFPAVFQSGNRTATYFYQGIIWVDEATHNIVTLRSDIQAPITEPRLDRLTTELRFRPVEIHDLNASLWLPSDVQLTIDQGTLVVQESHRYSNYHLYHSTSRIVP